MAPTHRGLLAATAAATIHLTLPMFHQSRSMEKHRRPPTFDPCEVTSFSRRPCRWKRCLPRHLAVLLLFFLAIALPLFCNAFDFGSLDPNPPGRIVPYQPVYKAVHFDEVAREYSQFPNSLRRKRPGRSYSTRRPAHKDDQSSRFHMPVAAPYSVTPSVERSQARSWANQLVTPFGAPFGLPSTGANERPRGRQGEATTTANKGKKSKKLSASHSHSKHSSIISDSSTVLNADYGEDDANFLFARAHFNASFTHHHLEGALHPNAAESDHDNVYLAFDSSEAEVSTESSRQKKKSKPSSAHHDDPPAESVNAEINELFDYSDEDVVDSAEKGALANGYVDANRFVTLDYTEGTTQEPPTPPLLQSFYKPQSDFNSYHQDDPFSLEREATFRKARYVFHTDTLNITWPVKKVAELPGEIYLGGLMMVHERAEEKICGSIMFQGGIQALEAMLFTIDKVNSREDILPGVKLGAKLLDDCDKDTYGLEQSIDFIKGKG